MTTEDLMNEILELRASLTAVSAEKYCETHRAHPMHPLCADLCPACLFETATDAKREVAEVSRRLAQVTTQLEQDRQLVFAIATESADELVKICGVHPNGDNERLNYLAELFAPEPDTALSAPEKEE